MWLAAHLGGRRGGGGAVRLPHRLPRRARAAVPLLGPWRNRIHNVAVTRAGVDGSSRPGQAAQLAERRKTARYGPAVVPLAFELDGRVGPTAEAWLASAAAAAQHWALGIFGPDGPGARDGPRALVAAISSCLIGGSAAFIESAVS